MAMSDTDALVCRYRLRPEDRLKRRSDFRAIQSKGTKVHTRHFLLMVSPERTDRGRVGITITRKVGNAVARNRVKRRVREVFRQHRDWFPSHHDVVFIAKRGAPELDFAAIAEEVRRARRRLLAVEEESTPSVLAGASVAPRESFN